MARRRRSRRGRGTKRNSLGRWVGRIVVGVVLLLVAASLGSYLWLKSYLGSEAFLEEVNARVSEALEAEAGFSKFEWDGMEVRSPSFTARGENLVREIALEDLETEVRFSALLRKKLKTSDVHIRRLHVELDATREAPEIPARKGTMDIAGVTIGDFSGEVGLGEGAVTWSGMQAGITGGANGYDATLSRGRLATPLNLFPDAELIEAKVRYSGGTLFVTRSDWEVYESGRLKADGEVRFDSGAYILNGDLTSILCEEVLPDDWKKRLRGRLSSLFTVEGRGKRAPVIEGDLEIEGGHLTALPVLDKIAAYTDTERFRRLALREARLHFRQQGERLELTRIVLASEGLVRVEGRLTIIGDQLDGSFQIGVPPGTLARIPGAETKVFAPGKSGMLWAPLTLGGTTSRPKEDLSDRLFAAAGLRMVELVAGEPVLKFSGRPVVGEVARSILERTKGAAEIGSRVLEGGRGVLENGVIEGGTDLVRDGVGSLLNGVLGDPSRGGAVRTREELEEEEKAREEAERRLFEEVEEEGAPEVTVEPDLDTGTPDSPRD